jgi:hypothetical protein
MTCKNFLQYQQLALMSMRSVNNEIYELHFMTLYFIYYFFL